MSDNRTLDCLVCRKHRGEVAVPGGVIFLPEVQLLEISKLPLFLVASLVLLLTPGPAVLYIIARSIDQGRGAGLVSVLSIETGNFFHVAAATLGLSALLLSSATLFTLVKYLGAAYLIYLGIRKWLSRSEPQETPKLSNASSWQIYYQGVVVAVLNPKTALFFLAFLPQFVDGTRGSIPLQMFELGSIFVIMACVTDSLYSLLAGTAGQWLKGNRLFLQGERYIAGSVYVGLGLVAALTDTTHK
jgi:threonine/homoserine/homoserine lactone efflux protein